MSADGDKAVSDLTTRFAAGVVMIAIASLAIYNGGWLFRALAALAAGVMMFEWSVMHRTPRAWTWAAVALTALATLVLPELLFPASAGDPAELQGDLLMPAWTGFGVIAGAGLLLGVFSRRLSLGWGYVYVCIPAFALVVLDWIWVELVFWMMVVVWSTDIFAYFAGRGIGGPKLAPRISPNKTWAGLIGGMGGAMVAGAAFGIAFEMEPVFLFLGAPLALLAQLGDLYESSVKRRLGVKDTGAILPGHGGVLDRVDGLLPVALAVLLILMASLG